MGLKRKKLESSRIQAKLGTIGGTTYWVDGVPRCLSSLTAEGKEHEYCFNGAGTRTDHVDSGRCNFHGGGVGAALKHGRYSKVIKNKLKDHFQEYINDPDLLDLTPELALQRSILSRLVEELGDSTDDDKIKMIKAMIADVTLTVDKIEKIQSQHVLTASAAKLMMARAVEVQRRLLLEWFEGDINLVNRKMEQFLLTWRSEVEP